MKLPLRVRVIDKLLKIGGNSSVVNKEPSQIPQFRAQTAVDANWATAWITRRPLKNVCIDDQTASLPGRDLRLRRYRPKVNDRGPLPVIVDFHGGGYVIGRAEMKDWFNCQLADRLPAIVVSVDYRLAPEHPFPAAHDDAIDSYSWLARNVEAWNGDPLRMAVIGDSAGASLAASVAIAMSDQHALPQPRAQVLLYPPTDFTALYESETQNADAPFLSAAEANAYLDLYCTREERADPRISPLHAEGLSRVARATIITAEHDPLRDQGLSYGAALAAAGVFARTTNYPGTAHGFMSTPGMYSAADHAVFEIANDLREALCSAE